MTLVAIRRTLTAAVPLALVLVALAPQASWALDAFLKISDCVGPVTRKGFEKQIKINGFNARVQSPTDAATGQATGKTIVSPIQILKDLDACSPQFFLDLVTNKNIAEATISFAKPDNTGREIVFFQVKLTNVRIIADENTTVSKTSVDDLRNIQEPTGAEVNNTALGSVQELLTLQFEKIQLTSLPGGQTAVFSTAAGSQD